VWPAKLEDPTLHANSSPPPVKRIVAVLWSDAALRDAALARLIEHWGAIDFVGPDHPFDATDYYVPEMGSPQFRRIVAFERLAPSEDVVDAKLWCNDLETGLAIEGKRKVNLDVGYLDHNKLVLASAKGMGQKIYLGRGIFADLVSRYAKGRYVPFEWAFPDFKQGRYDVELAALRQRYLVQLSERRTAN
jgi:hypothetical protein